MELPSGSSGLGRDDARALCSSSNYWLPEILTSKDLSSIKTAARWNGGKFSLSPHEFSFLWDSSRHWSSSEQCDQFGLF